MCPVVLLAMILSLLLFLLELTAALSVAFTPQRITGLKEGETETVSFVVNDVKNDKFSSYSDSGTLEVLIDDTSIADIVGNNTFYYDTSTHTSNYNNYSFELKGKFLGHTWLHVIKHSRIKSNEQSVKLDISVVRTNKLISRIFTVSVIVLVSINYINMGCALDLNVVLNVIKKPIAPAIGFICQYAFMPLIAYFIGNLLFDQTQYALRLGLFTFGCSPGGGASNMWTVLLSGNLNLSITMTFISTLSALFMMPLWLFTLGRSIYGGTATKVPLHSIFGTLASMTIFLGVGLLIQRFKPNVANFCRKILAPVSIAMIIFIVIFGTYANLYMFRLMSSSIIFAAALNVYLGFILGFTCSWAIRQPLADRIAIAVETGVQNTGVSIVLLGLSLSQPDADLASVVPVAASVMTPIPLTVAIIIIKLRNYFSKKKVIHSHMFDDEDRENEKLDSNKTSNSTLSKTITDDLKENYKTNDRNNYI